MTTTPPPPARPAIAPPAVAPTDPADPDAPLPASVAALDDQSQARFEQVRRLSHLLDNQFAIPGTDIRFGIDALISLVPGIGGILGLALSGVVIAQGIAVGARGATVARMLLNAGADAVLSSIPFVGWLSDLVFKANARNVRLLSTHVLDPERTRAESLRLVLITLAVVLVVMALLAGAAITAVVALLTWIF